LTDLHVWTTSDILSRSIQQSVSFIQGQSCQSSHAVLVL